MACVRSYYNCFAVILSLALLSAPVKARIIRIEITGNAIAFKGKSFGSVGPYQCLKGKAYGEVDPRLPQNAKITDIQLAPRNARGMVAYSTDFYILKPADLSRGNHKQFVELPNRGSKPFGPFNKSRGGNDPGAADQPDDAFLMGQGYTIAWCGWDISAAPGENNLTVNVPVAVNEDGSAITGPAYEYISFDNSRTQNYKLAYPAAVIDNTKATLTCRALLNDEPQKVYAAGWEFTDEHTIRLLPAGTAFKQSYIYELLYTAKDPKVAGLGLAATRDFVSFLRYGTSADANPLAGDVRYAYSFAISQPARYMNDLQTLGFNLDEQGRRVFDGIENWLGGGSGVGINYRFAQPGRTERNRQNHLYPEGIFPFAYPILHDPLASRNGGRLAGYPDPAKMPKVLEINSANEYWVKAASLLHSTPDGKDLADPPNVSFYLVSGMQHGSGSATSAGSGQQLQNPTRPEALLRALFIALDEWVTKGIAPPASQVPRRADNTAALAEAVNGKLTGIVSKTVIGWPDIPGVTYTGLITTRRAYNYGPEFSVGILNNPIPQLAVPAYQNSVSKVDADGNEVAGIRLPPVAAPLATLTGWALRREGFGLNDGAESAGQSIPFKKTKAERLEAGDPRLSLEERYGDHAGYVKAVTVAVRQLQARRLLLPQDAEDYIKEAEMSGVLR